MAADCRFPLPRYTDVVSATLGSDAAIVISVIALFATANTVLMSMYASSRILYGMAGSSEVTARLGWVDPVRRTPWIAILICGGLSLLLIFAGDIAFIANVTNFTLFITFIVINAAVIVLRYIPPKPPALFEFLSLSADCRWFLLQGFFSVSSCSPSQDLAVLTLGVVLTGVGVVLMVIIGHYPSRRA